MGTKWKNSLLLIGSVILCLGGWYLSITFFNQVENSKYDYDYIDSYFSDDIYMEDILKNFKKTDKDSISTEQVYSYRMKYGDLDTQVLDIYNQYQEKIINTQDKKQKETLGAERDKKIKAVTDNFTSDDVVRNKIIQEEQDYIEKNKDDLLKDIELTLKDINNNFSYYFKNEETGAIYSNVSNLNEYSSDKTIKKELKKLGTGTVFEDQNEARFESLIHDNILFQESNVIFKTFYVVKKDSEVAKQLIENKKNADFFGKLVYAGLVTMIAGVVVLYIYINTVIVFERLRKLPTDLLLILFLGLGFLSAIQILMMYTYDLGVGISIRSLVFRLGIGVVPLVISFVSLKLMWWQLLPKYREYSFKELMKRSLCFRVFDKGVAIFNTLPIVLKLVVIGFILLANVFVLQLYRNIYYSFGFTQPILGLLILAFFMVEIWLAMRYFKKVYELLKKPKIILKNYQEDVNSEFSLEEVNNELLALDELVRLSQKYTMQSEMLKTELLTNVSHDLRTPLTSIITYGDLLTQPNITKEEQTKYIEIINKKSLRMKHLIDDLFEVTKMNNGEIILEKHEVNLGNLLQQAVSERSEEFKEHKLKMVFNKPEEDIVLPLDGERMWRVFDNMFGNVLKYAMPDTRVYLKLETINDQVKIELKNISRHELNEDAEELVEKFKRGDSSRHTEGSGLGLAIINSIVSLHEGTLEIIVDGDMFKLVICL